MTDTHVETKLTMEVMAALGDVTHNGVSVPVYRSRRYPRAAKDMPCILVYAPSTGFADPVRGQAPGRRVIRRTVDVKVAILFSRPATVEDPLEDDIAEIGLQVETKLAGAFAVGTQTIVSSLTPRDRNTGAFADASVPCIACAYSYVAVLDHVEGDATTTLKSTRSE